MKAVKAYTKSVQILGIDREKEEKDLMVVNNQAAALLEIAKGEKEETGK